MQGITQEAKVDSVGAMTILGHKGAAQVHIRAGASSWTRSTTREGAEYVVKALTGYQDRDDLPTPTEVLWEKVSSSYVTITFDVPPDNHNDIETVLAILAKHGHRLPNYTANVTIFTFIGVQYVQFQFITANGDGDTILYAPCKASYWHLSKLLGYLGAKPVAQPERVGVLGVFIFERL